jgi:hypothetical protein
MTLDATDNELIPFLDNPSDVQVSLCTGVSRRVTLRRMRADLMPAFSDASTNPDDGTAWEKL